MNSVHLLLLAFNLALCWAARHPDEIIALPGLIHRINFKQYSGYLNASEDKFFYYWFVESQRSPTTDPLVLWMNGGPGCSSLSGLLTENGPFAVKEDGKTLKPNHYSWNKIANVVYLESPAGTGFSFSSTPQTYLDDDVVSLENYNALKHFFLKFPQFAKHDFFITGESYGGIYVPTLSVRVLDGPMPINFKGFAIGNGCMDMPINSNSLLFFAYYHGFMGSEEWNRLVTLCCDGDHVSPYGCNFQKGVDTKCQNEGMDYLEKLLKADLNIYNVFETCSKTANIKARYSFDHARLLQGIGLKRPSSEASSWDLSCLESPNVHHYLNRDSVRQALHVPTYVKEWIECSDTINAMYNKNHQTMKDEFLHLLNSGKVRGLIYNGDIDMVCNFLGDEWFSHTLGLEVIQPYTQWKYDDQIAGFAIYFRNLAFLTVKGSGHMVPTDKPGPAFQMIANFLENKSY